MVRDTQHVGTALRAKSFTMVPCQIPVNYEIAIPKSMTLGTGEKWLHRVEIIPSGPGRLECILSLTKETGGHSALTKSAHEQSIIAKMQMISFLHLSGKLCICCYAVDPISSRNGCISCIL